MARSPSVASVTRELARRVGCRLEFKNFLGTVRMNEMPRFQYIL